MKEEAQGFPTAWGSTGFPLHPKALEVSENEFIFGKSKLTTGIHGYGTGPVLTLILIQFSTPIASPKPNAARL
jgi:hypothetical protein